jgi:hypothetical protein
VLDLPIVTQENATDLLGFGNQVDGLTADSIYGQMGTKPVDKLTQWLQELLGVQMEVDTSLKRTPPDKASRTPLRITSRRRAVHHN